MNLHWKYSFYLIKYLNSNAHSLFIETAIFFKTAQNGYCEDHQRASTTDAASCRLAAAEMNKDVEYIKFHGEETRPDWPKGCYTTGSRVFFNKHTEGARHSRAHHICYKGNSCSNSLFMFSYVINLSQS